MSCKEKNWRVIGDERGAVAKGAARMVCLTKLGQTIHKQYPRVPANVFQPGSVHGILLALSWRWAEEGRLGFYVPSPYHPGEYAASHITTNTVSEFLEEWVARKTESTNRAIDALDGVRRFAKSK